LKKIKSFELDHTKLKKGLYISRVDGNITSFDLRMKQPYKDALLSPVEIHSFEHLLASVLRSGKLKDKILYVGPMGCATGFYVLVSDANIDDFKPVLIDALKFIAYECSEMYGGTKAECGNYKTLDLKIGKKCALDYLGVLL